MIYGKKDPQDALVMCRCIHCGQEIYSGDAIYIPAEYTGWVHDGCMKDWLFENYADKLGVEGTATEVSHD